MSAFFDDDAADDEIITAMQTPAPDLDHESRRARVAIRTFVSRYGDTLTRAPHDVREQFITALTVTVDKLEPYKDDLPWSPEEESDYEPEAIFEEEELAVAHMEFTAVLDRLK